MDATATALDEGSENSVTLRDVNVKHETATGSEAEISEDESYGDDIASDDNSPGDRDRDGGQTGRFNLFALDQVNLSPIPHSLLQYDFETEVTSPSRSLVIDSVTGGNKTPVALLQRSMTGDDGERGGHTSSLGLTGLAAQYGLASQQGL